MRLTSVNLQNAQLRGINFSDCDLTGADFSGAILIEVDLDQADLTDADVCAGIVKLSADLQRTLQAHITLGGVQRLGGTSSLPAGRESRWSGSIGDISQWRGSG
ncbi:MAG: hypothetical protein CL569_10395 [Alphaproteobacteria bacterium]|nr:hypothetical protein [Alphaproteobacteria bacterium]